MFPIQSLKDKADTALQHCSVLKSLNVLQQLSQILVCYLARNACIARIVLQCTFMIYEFYRVIFRYLNIYGTFVTLKSQDWSIDNGYSKCLQDS